MFKAEIKGLNEVLRKIERYKKELADDIDKDLSAAAEDIAAMARQKAPVGTTGALGGYIVANTSVKYNKFISAFAPYAPYVEFGTGIKVFKTPEFNFTPEMRAYAREFYVSGKGRQPARPFLFPSLEIGKVKLINKIKARLLPKQL